MERSAKRRLVQSGPRNIPAGPKNIRPPKTESNTKSGWSCIPLPTSLGPRKLSISPTATTLQINSPIADVVAPMKNK